MLNLGFQENDWFLTPVPLPRWLHMFKHLSAWPVDTTVHIIFPVIPTYSHRRFNTGSTSSNLEYISSTNPLLLWVHLKILAIPKMHQDPMLYPGYMNRHVYIYIYIYIYTYINIYIYIHHFSTFFQQFPIFFHIGYFPNGGYPWVPQLQTCELRPGGAGHCPAPRSQECWRDRCPARQFLGHRRNVDEPVIHRIGWWENLQESPIFDGKNHGFL